MKILIWVLSMTAMNVWASSNSRVSFQTLSEMKWQYRILLIEESEDYQQVLSDASNEIKDRHLVWFLVTSEQILSNLSGPIPKRLQQDIRKRNVDNEVILIGKDGGVKLRKKKLNLPYIFSTIDAMPMRQAEMNSMLL